MCKYSRGEHPPSYWVPGAILYLEDAINAIEIGMREQHYKDVVLGHLHREIQELKALARG